jgi:hypothetical protein
MTQLGDEDGPGETVPVGVGHGTGEPPVPTRHVALGDGPGDDDAVGVGHGTGEPPVPTRHDGDGLGATTNAFARLWLSPGIAELPLPPPPPHAAHNTKIPRARPSRRMPETPKAP